MRNSKAKGVGFMLPPHVVTHWQAHLVECNLKLSDGPRAELGSLPPENQIDSVALSFEISLRLKYSRLGLNV